MKIKQFTAVAGGVAALAFAGSAAAVAAPYDGTNPYTSGCGASAYTVTTKPVKNVVTGATVANAELRFSTTCKTNWVRVNNTVGGTATKGIGRIGETYYSEVDSGQISSFSMQVYAPGSTCVQWGVHIKNGSNYYSTGQSVIVTC